MDFNKNANEMLEMLFEFCEDNGIDSDILNEILYIDVDKGQYVINKHSVTRQIWVSSPVSSASKFTYDESEQKWLSNGRELYDLITSELKS